MAKYYCSNCGGKRLRNITKLEDHLSDGEFHKITTD